MTPFQYVAPLTSIVIALGITRILTGLGRTVQMRGSVRTYWVHTLWTGNVFLWLLLSVLLLPDSLEIGSDLKRRFYQNSHWFFALAALLPPIDALDTLLNGAAHFQAQGPIHVVTIALLIVLFITINLRVLA